MKFLIIPLVLSVSIITTSVIADPYMGIGIGEAYYKVDLSSLSGGDFEEDTRSACDRAVGLGS